MAGFEWEADYWQALAVEKSWKPWWIGWTGWPLVWVGNDEYLRRTLVVGPVVFPLWRCRCRDCRALLTDLKRRVDAPEEDQ